MGTNKWPIIFLLFAGIFVFTAQQAIGGCEVTYLDDLIESGNAPGTKYDGTITIFFDLNDYPQGPLEDNLSDMYYFLRLRKGYSKYSFSGVYPAINWEQSNIPAQMTVINGFLYATVIPYLFDCTAGSCPDFYLKSYKWDVNEEDPPVPGDILHYWIIDIVIGVHD